MNNRKKRMYSIVLVFRYLFLALLTYTIISGIGITIYDSFGIDTTGEVQDVWESHLPKDGDYSSYYGKVQYEVNEKSYIKKRVYLDTAKKNSNNKFMEKQVALTYLQSYPNIAITTPEKGDYLGIIIALVGTVSGFILTSIYIVRN